MPITIRLMHGNQLLMSTTSLQNKTIRPGSLTGYSYYYSDRRRTPVPQPKPSRAARKPHPLFKKLALTAAVIVALIGLPLLRSDPAAPSASLNSAAKQLVTTPTPSPVTATPAVAAASDNHCAGNTLDKFILVSISQRHLWACEGSKTVHDAPVITGILAHPETLTPPGTYTVAGKQTDTRLKGTDSAGSWDYPVSYWMPFLSNEHGVYGFHDAGWRDQNSFGQVDPASGNASHGCVELPLASQKWLYNWAPVHTTLTIQE